MTSKNHTVSPCPPSGDTDSRFVFRIPPDPALLARLALNFYIDPKRKAEDVEQEALCWLGDWQARCEQVELQLRSKRSPGEEGQQESALTLLREVGRAGTRVWLGAVFNVDCAIRGMADLAAWCRLQLRVIAIAREVLPIPLGWQGEIGFLDDRLLFETAEPFFEEGATFDPLPAILSGLSWTPPEDETYSYLVSGFEQEEEPFPHRLRLGNFASLQWRAWVYLGRVAHLAESECPVEPDAPKRASDCVLALMSLRRWAGAETQKHTPQSPESIQEVSAPTTQSPVGQKGQRLSGHEAQEAVKRYLQDHPDATVKEVNKATGVSSGSISQMEVWQSHKNRKAVRKQSSTSQPLTLPQKVKMKRLTDKMLASVGYDANPSVQVELKEAAWIYLERQAQNDPEELARLRSYSPDEKALLIEITIDQIQDQLHDEMATE